MASNSFLFFDALPLMKIGPMNIELNETTNIVSPASILNNQLHSPAGSVIHSPSEFHEGTAIPPKKLFGSSLLDKITKVEPYKNTTF